MNREKLVGHLSSLSVAELGDIINAVSRNLRKDKEFEGGDFEYDDILCLALCSFGAFKGEMDETAIIEVYSGAADETCLPGTPLTEQSTCNVCGVSLVSNSKRVNCPICYAPNELT